MAKKENISRELGFLKEIYYALYSPSYLDLKKLAKARGLDELFVPLLLKKRIVTEKRPKEFVWCNINNKPDELLAIELRVDLSKMNSEDDMIVESNNDFNFNMDKYEIHIGETLDFKTGTKKPKQTIIINKDQLDIIETFANQRKDEELNTVYRINDCEFRIFPYFNGFV